MHWIAASLVSALFLGVYELCTKHAVRDNAVVPVLFFSTLSNPASLVSVVMNLRRGSTLVAFAGGLLLFGEGNGLKKLPAVIGILVGIVLTVMG
jgi:drug/metabolite transporter (DMT)-like permease